MMKGINRIASLLILLGCHLAMGQSFVPVSPDTAKIKGLWIEQDYRYSMAYHYLHHNYQLESERDSVKFLYPSDEEPCYFVEHFESGIRYRLSTCDEEGGGEEFLHFPKMDLKTARSFIEKLFYDKWNKWTDEYHYQPDGAGCYYSIVQGADYTEIRIWCGC